VDLKKEGRPDQIIQCSSCFLESEGERVANRNNRSVKLEHEGAYLAFNGLKIVFLLHEDCMVRLMIGEFKQRRRSRLLNHESSGSSCMKEIKLFSHNSAPIFRDV